MKDSIERYSDEIRAALPNRTLLIHFDRQNALMAGLRANTAHYAAGTQAGMDLTSRMIQLTIRSYWFSRSSGSSPSSAGTESLKRESAAAWTSDNQEEKRRLLERIQALAITLRDQTIANIQQSWRDAGRSGKQADLVETWKTRMRWIEDLGSPGGVIDGQSGKTLSSDDQAESNRRSASETPPKTWIEFKLIDIDGKPMANEEFEVVLPNGSRRSGSLDSQGMTRFDEVDPGQCKISFPQIDGREWRAV